VGILKEDEVIKNIIKKLTQRTNSILTETLIFEAGEFGIGEQQVYEALGRLKEENYIIQPMPITIEIVSR